MRWSLKCTIHGRDRGNSITLSSFDTGRCGLGICECPAWCQISGRTVDDGVPCRGCFRGRPDGSVLPGCQPDEVAPGAHHLVFPEKTLRASLSRPSLDEVLAFRTHVDEWMETLFTRQISGGAVRRIVLGLNHEQQHQALMLTDIKHAFYSNPLRPAFAAAPFAVARDVNTTRSHEIRRTPSTFASITKPHATRSTWNPSGSPAAPSRVANIWSSCPMMRTRGLNFGFLKAGRR